MCKKVEKIIYWISLVGPIFDVLKGTVLGLISAYKSVRAERDALSASEKLKKMQEQFENDNNQTQI